jgi:hypothetical protein
MPSLWTAPHVLRSSLVLNCCGIRHQEIHLNLSLEGMLITSAVRDIVRSGVNGLVHQIYNLGWKIQKADLGAQWSGC